MADKSKILFKHGFFISWQFWQWAENDALENQYTIIQSLAKPPLMVLET